MASVFLWCICDRSQEELRRSAPDSMSERDPSEGRLAHISQHGRSASRAVFARLIAVKSRLGADFSWPRSHVVCSFNCGCEHISKHSYILLYSVLLLSPVKSAYFLISLSGFSPEFLLNNGTY